MRVFVVTIRAALLAGASVGVVVGCQGHGKYTSEFKDEAVARLNALKSQTAQDMATADLQSSNIERAFDHAHEAVLLTPESAEARLLLGRVFIEMQQPEQALEQLAQAMQLDPLSAEPHYYAGTVYERFGQTLSALESYARAFQLEPTEEQYLLTRVEMLIEMGELDRAKGMLSDHADRFRFVPAVKQTEAHLALIRNEPEEAVALFREAMLQAPEDKGIREDLARAQIRVARFSEADRTLERLLRDEEYAERRPDLVHLRARCLLELNRPMEARSMLIELTRRVGGQNDADAWRQLGTVSLVLSDPRLLKEAADTLMAIAPERYEGYFFLAIWQQANVGPEAALATLERAVTRARVEGVAEPANLQSVIYAELGQKDLALSAARTALEIEPENEQALVLVESLNINR
ncbi:MAG: tetratricopeptide repeat protein [Planctomycetota bacterium]